MKLSKKAITMLKLIDQHMRWRSGGVVVYGRGPTETIMSLRDKGLVDYTEAVPVLSMDKIILKPRWFLTEDGLSRLLENI